MSVEGESIIVPVITIVIDIIIISNISLQLLVFSTALFLIINFLKYKPSIYFILFRRGGGHVFIPSIMCDVVCY